MELNFRLGLAQNQAAKWRGRVGLPVLCNEKKAHLFHMEIQVLCRGEASSASMWSGLHAEE